ncbi:MAG: manganese efflux pump MntP family protein [Sedimentisphaeraceae bacterium JB056]
MGLITILCIAVGLAMDAFSVSVATGAVYKKMHIKHIFRMAFFFGFFQMFMPILGWLGASAFKDYIQAFDHWIAFGILLVVGGKMIYEAFSLEDADKKNLEMTIFTLLVLSVATSIDALAVGITLSLLKIDIIETVAIIGLVTFILSLIGVKIGMKFGHIFENKIEIAGGILLILIGLKILLTDLLAVS